MFGTYLSRKANSKKTSGKRSPQAEQLERDQLDEYGNWPIMPKLSDMVERLKAEMGNSPDLTIRQLYLAGGDRSDAAVIYIQNMVDDQRLEDFIILRLQADESLGSLMREAADSSGHLRAQAFDKVKGQLLPTGVVNELKTFKELFGKLFLGYAIVLVDGCATGLAANVSGGAKRAIEEPQTELALRGPREGFTESIRTNVMLIRRKIRSPKLWLEQRTVGELTETPVGIMYIQGLADENVLADLHNRLDSIQIDGILETGYIEEMITDQKWSPFPTVMNNERPDVIASYLLEGRIVILVDGTPFVLAVPAVLNMFFQAAEDYYHGFQMATFLRMLRFVAFVVALLMPSIYVAIIGYHQEMIPTQLLLKLAAQREGVPFPAYLEAFIMEFVFEILREAVLRMPSTSGNAISIVGGLVIGQSVVEAGIVSSAVVIVVSMTAIASFVTPVYNLGIAARLLRFLLLLAASTLGFYGIALVVLLLLLHLSNLRSFGMAYLKPFAPFNWSDLKDTLVRVPMWMMKERPKKLADDNKIRQNIKLKPRKEPSQ